MRRTMHSARRALLGGQPVLTGTVVAGAAGTAALQSSGFVGWWALPVLMVGLLWAAARARRSRP